MGGHPVHGNHNGVHFEKASSHQVECLLWENIASKYVNLLLNLVIFCMVAMLAAILKTNVYEGACEVEHKL